MLQWWSEFREKHSSKLLICNQIIWNNRNIKVDKKPVFYKHFVDKRIVYLNDLDFEKNSINSLEGKDLMSKYILHWLGIRAAVPLELKNSIMKVTETSLKFKSNKGTFDSYKSKCENYYEILIEEKVTKSRGFKKIQTKYKLEDKHVNFVHPPGTITGSIFLDFNDSVMLSSM